MSRVALVSSEPIRPAMAGIGIRYAELARRLPEQGIEILLVSPSDPAAARAVVPGTDVQRFERGRLAEILAGCDAAVAQGQLANDVILELPGLPLAIDLYDPWLVENFAYRETLGLDPYRNDHATWVLQLSAGDFFLCSSEEQRTFYLGFLTALGRVNPERIADDPDLETLIAPVPFGVPEALPPHRPVLQPRAPGERRLLFGGLYDWYDPWTLLEVLGGLGDLRDLGGLGGPGGPGGPCGDWTLYLIRNPNPESTPQRLLSAVEDRCRSLGWWGSRVQILDWVPADRRYDLLRDVDLLVAPHRPSLETRLSLRTRFLDALAAGCPVITSEGGAMSRLLAAHDAGWVTPPGDAPALARALAEALAQPGAKQQGAQELLRHFAWDRVLAPLVGFCRSPRRDPSKDRFTHRPQTVAPADPLGFRLKRRLRAWRRWE